MRMAAPSSSAFPLRLRPLRVTRQARVSEKCPTSVLPARLCGCILPARLCEARMDSKWNTRFASKISPLFSLGYRAEL